MLKKPIIQNKKIVTKNKINQYEKYKTSLKSKKQKKSKNKKGWGIHKNIVVFLVFYQPKKTGKAGTKMASPTKIPHHTKKQKSH